MTEILILKHVPFEGPGTFYKELQKRGLRFREVNLYKETLPNNLDRCGGIIIMGGPMNVYEEAEYPFLKDEDGLIKEALAKKVPMLGVCLGAQLMAKAAGAKVTKGPKKEIGWYPLYLTEDAKNDPVFKALPEVLEVFQWHGDTFEIPDDAVRLASSELFPNQAFRIGDNAYAFQFHVEVTNEIIASWIMINNEELLRVKEYINPDAVLSDTKKKTGDLERLAKSMYAGLFNIFSKDSR